MGGDIGKRNEAAFHLPFNKNDEDIILAGLAAISCYCAFLPSEAIGF